MAIMTCVCSHPFQDRRYGDKKRVANETGASAKSSGQGQNTGHRCTVCGKSIIKPIRIKKVKRMTEPDKKKRDR